ncbi:unnamed protein product, partial [Adineta ricciae]
MKVKPNDLLAYSVSIEQADKYAAYLATAVSTSDKNNITLCICTEQNTFDTDRIVEEVTNWHKYHGYGKMQCYETVQCDSGLRCLDWRDICDGEQQCMFGVDEDNYDLLEFNECEPDEYRCSNGMCIPQEYFLD